MQCDFEDVAHSRLRRISLFSEGASELPTMTIPQVIIEQNGVSAQ